MRRAYEVLGLAPGVSPFKARQRYRELVKEWHPDRRPKDPESQDHATRRTQALTEAYHRIKTAARHGEVPLRPPRAWRPSPTQGAPVPVVDTLRDRVVRFFGGVVIGAALNLFILPDSAALWIGLPLTVGIIAAVFGWAALEWLLEKLWWLA